MWNLWPNGRKVRAVFPPWQTAFALDALRRGWLAVRANKGQGGPDGQTLADFERSLEDNLRQLQTELLQRAYRPHRVTQVLVPKPDGRWRPLTLWTIRDRVAQRATLDYLSPVFEAQFLPCSYGFRPGRTTRDAALAIAQARQAGAHWVFDADIKDCFGQMESDRLRRQLEKIGVPRPICGLIQDWLQARVWNSWQGAAKTAGTSQGGVISPLLCNLYLHPFDLATQKPDLWLVRYADDFVILSRKRAAIMEAAQAAAANLKALGLDIHPQKSRITHFDEGFQFVGWFFVHNKMFQLK
jgi:group II intron reverse transcriptase/maturase